MNLKFLENYTQQEVLKVFYISGAVIFLIVGVANTVTNFYYWESMILSAKVSALFMNLFNYFLSVFFFVLFKGITREVKSLDKEEIEEIIDDVKSKKGGKIKNA